MPPVGRRFLRLAACLAAVAALLGRGAPAWAQEAGCDLTRSREFVSLQAGEGEQITYISGPLTFMCGEGLRIDADSAVVFSATNFSRLLGAVRIVDGARILTADRANYFSLDGRMVAWGGTPQLLDTLSGTVIEGDTIRLFRASDRRPEDELVVTGGRPHAILYPAPVTEDSTALEIDIEPDSATVGDSLAIPGDSIGGPADSLAVPPDTLGTQPDTLVTPADTLATPADTIATPADTLAPRADTLATPADTLATPADTLATPADTLATPVDTLVTPEDSPGLEVDPGIARDSTPPVAEPITDEGLELVADTTPPLPDTLIRPPGFIPGEPEDSAGTQGVGLDPGVEPAPRDTLVTPFDLRADRIFLRGGQYMRATGDVEVVRDSLEAFADSLEYDQGSGVLMLRDQALLLSSAFTLSGEEMDLLLPGGEISEVQARRRAVLSGTDLDMTAPQIRLYLEEGALERLVAVDWAELPTDFAESDPEGAELAPEQARAPLEVVGAEGQDEQVPDSLELNRPTAKARDFTLRADSIEVLAPGQRLDHVVASGSARGESFSRDSLNSPSMPEALKSDWIEGDTILAEFGEVVPEESELTEPGATPTGGVTLRRLTATGSARSLYRLDPAVVEVDSTGAEADSVATEAVEAVEAVQDPEPDEEDPEAEPPEVDEVDEEGFAARLPLHFVTGSRIVIEMSDGAVDRMQVDGPARGMYLEPLAPNRPSGGTAVGAGDGG